MRAGCGHLNNGHCTEVIKNTVILCLLLSFLGCHSVPWARCLFPWHPCSVRPLIGSPVIGISLLPPHHWLRACPAFPLGLWSFPQNVALSQPLWVVTSHLASLQEHPGVHLLELHGLKPHIPDEPRLSREVEGGTDTECCRLTCLPLRPQVLEGHDCTVMCYR